MTKSEREGQGVDRFEIEERIVQPSEIHDTLADVEGAVRSVDTSCVRITVEPVTLDQHRANEALADAVEETDVCLGCGDPIDEGGFCELSCLQKMGEQP